MRGITLLFSIFLLAGCGKDELSWISIRNDTTLPIFALPYSSDFANGKWIQPGSSNDFYSLNFHCLEGYEYFSFYYDSVIIFLKNMEEAPIKLYKDGSTVNYDPAMNPFINPDVWKTRDFDRHMETSGFNTLEEKHIYEHYFRIDPASVTSLSDSF